MELYRDPNANPEKRAADLLDRMSFEEKVAQLVGYNPADWSSDDLDRDYPLGAGQVSFLAGTDKKSIYEAAEFQRKIQRKMIERSPHGIPAIFHVETLCGVMLPGAVTFPSGIGQGATFDPACQKEIGKLIGKQARLAGASQAFAPVLDISRDSRFGRQGETYGEDPALASAMGSAYVQGVQQDGELKKGAAATAKHFLGYHDSQGGIHAAACDIPERLLREVYARPFQAAVSEADMQGIMPCYSSINGVPTAGSKELLTDLLKEEMGFSGLVVSDYCAISEIHERHHVCESLEEAGRMALMAGMDQELPSRKCYTQKAFQKYLENEKLGKRLDEAVKKVLILKFRLGLFEHPYAAHDGEIREEYEKPENHGLALRAALESMVLIKNNGVLPLKKKKQTIAVIGYHAASLRAMFGGYTYMSMTEGALGAGNTMAGMEGSQEKGKGQKYPGTIVEKEHPDAEKMAEECYSDPVTLLRELKNRMPETRFLYAWGYPCAGNDDSGYPEAYAAAQEADVIVMTVGGKYGTGTTASMGEGIDATDINLPPCQEELIKNLGRIGKPMVLIHFGGRPISSDAADRYAGGILEAWNPGEKGASAIVSVLLGEYNPGGKMPVTTAYCAGQIPVYYNHPYGSSYDQNTISAFRQYVDCPHEPRYYFGHGLSYTTFFYKNLRLKKRSLNAKEALECMVEIENTGKTDGQEVVQLYIRDWYASMVRPVMELAGFYRVSLKAGETKQILFRIRQEQLAFLDRRMRWKIEAGEMEVMVGASAGDIRLRDRFRIETDQYIEGNERSFYAEAGEI